MSVTSKTKVVTGKVRFSYANVFEPTAAREGEEKFYSVCLLIPKSDKETIAKLEAAIEAAAEAGASKWGGKPKKIKLPLRDGDEEKDSPEFEGMLFINAKSARKPQVVDSDLNPIMDKDEFYSGCWGRASINFYPYDFQGTKGVAVGLINLQKKAEGDRLGGDFSSAEDDFGDDLM